MPCECTPHIVWYFFCRGEIIVHWMALRLLRGGSIICQTQTNLQIMNTIDLVVGPNMIFDNCATETMHGKWEKHFRISLCVFFSFSSLVQQSELTCECVGQYNMWNDDWREKKYASRDWDERQLSREKDLNGNNCSIYVLTMAIYYDLFAVYIDDWMEFCWAFFLNWIEPKLQQLDQMLIFMPNKWQLSWNFRWILPISISLNAAFASYKCKNSNFMFSLSTYIHTHWLAGEWLNMLQFTMNTEP